MWARRSCIDVPTCEAVLFDTSDGTCFRKREVRVEQCLDDDDLEIVLMTTSTCMCELAEVCTARAADVWVEWKLTIPFWRSVGTEASLLPATPPPAAVNRIQ